MHPFLLCKNTVVSSGLRNNSTYKQFNGGFLSPPFPFNMEPSSVVSKGNLSFPTKPPLPQALLPVTTQGLPSPPKRRRTGYGRTSTSFPVYRAVSQRVGSLGLRSLSALSFQLSHLGNPIGFYNGLGR